MIRRLGWCLVIGGLGALTPSTMADQFEQLDGPTLVRTLKGPDAKAAASLTVSDLGAMPALLRDSRSALVLARTDRGNPARLLIVPELRKPADGKGEPIPVVVLERLDAFDAADPSTRLASRRDVVVFDGFQVDLDSGQVVPEGQGGDVIFRAKGENGPRLEILGDARLFTLAKAPALDNAKAPQPTPGRAVLPGDFAGRYRLFCNGQSSGTLDLKVEARGVVTGLFRSDLHGTTYPVSGQVATDAAQKVLFAIKYPRARQEFEGYLWAEGKGAMAGLASIAERSVGFFAIREGGRSAPEGSDVGPIAAGEADRPGRCLVEVRGEQIRLDGNVATFEELAAALRPRIDNPEGPAPWVVLRAPADSKFADILKVVENLRALGIKTVRFEAPGPEKDEAKK